MRIKSVTALITAAGLLTSVGAALAADPTQADFDACNKEAQARQSSPSASPSTSGGPTGSMSGSTSKDHPASTSGGGATSGTPSGSTGSSVSGGAAPSTDADVALRGIDASGKSDPAFQAAYRECMKQRGF
jgi:hypothetical protein